MGLWTGTQRAFTLKVFYKNGESFVIAQREFRREFGIHRNRSVPSARAINTWVRNLEATGSTLKMEGGSVKTVLHPTILPMNKVHAVLRVAILCHSGCLEQAFDRFYMKIFTSSPIKFKLLMH
jgi:hypothetical protein